MINKDSLVSFIKKYYLNGKTESVIWKVSQNGNLKVDFTPTIERELIGCIQTKDFFNPEKDIEIGVYNTNHLLKILSLLDNNIDIKVDVNPKNNKALKINFNDELFNTTYSAADIFVIPQPGKLRNQPEYQFEFDFSNDLKNLIKAKNALPDESNIVHLMSKGNGDLVFTFGGTLDHTNKIKYTIKNIKDNVFTFDYSINSELFKHILNENSEMESKVMKININGMINLEFKNSFITSNYYLIRKNEQ